MKTFNVQRSTYNVQLGRGFANPVVLSAAAVRVRCLGGKVTFGLELARQGCVQWGGRLRFPGDGVAADVSQLGVAGSPGGAGARALLVRRLRFRPRLAARYAGQGSTSCWLRCNIGVFVRFGMG
ncbi:MAG: hypothetical protein GX456_19570 [Verrucomicrobia bacterium]|nr:hypothetical protein [Verrucomicrobiota bacterium]